MHDNFASVGASGGVAYISSSATIVRPQHDPCGGAPARRHVPFHTGVSLLDSAGSIRGVHTVLGRSTCHRPAVFRVASIEHHLQRVGELVHLRRDA